MKKRLLTLLATLTIFVSHADEGIWLPSLISQRITDMQSKGFRLTAEDIYSINNASMKDGVMLFGGGCTAEIISDQGLVLTNHHCGYGAIQSHSSVEHDYLTDGFSAQTLSDEKVNPTLNVKFLVRMEDVTERITEGETAEQIRNQVEQGGVYKASVEPLYYANQWFLFVYEQFDDVRLVAAPPSSIGKFGGDTDNWIWPRHTGDFSIFRIYADKNNRPAKYAADNVPYTPRHYFPISTKGVEQGDFTMIYGFPGTTQQYITSDAVDYIVNIANPMKIALRTKRLDIISEAQEADPAVRIKYAAKHANIANAWKKWQGEELGLRRLKTLDAKRAYEQKFQAWADQRGEYTTLLDSMHTAYTNLTPDYHIYELVRESVGAIELISLMPSLKQDVSDATLDRFFKDYVVSIDQKIAVEMLLELSERLKALPSEYTTQYNELIAKHNSEQEYVNYLFANTKLTDIATIKAAQSSGTLEQMVKADPAAELRKIFEPLLSTYLGRNLSDMEDIAKWYAPYLEALPKFDPERAFFPDANLTLRVAYGQVGGYQYADGVYHKHLTTIEGILAKDNPEIYDYDIPQKLRDKLTQSDLGRWAIEVDGRKTIPVCFLANNQTTGGNSGSPILNADGELVGLNFDRTWLSTMSDVAFDPSFCRNISVDIRYVLFVLEEVIDAKHLVDEMELK